MAEDIDPREQLADAFDTDSDPLATHAATFEVIDADPFAVFLRDILPEQDPASGTIRGYRRVIEQWQTYMEQTDRHPACPADHHVKGFIRYCRETRDNRSVTIETKLRRLRYVVSSWQLDPVFPHHEGYNPFARVLQHTDLSREPTKEPPRLSVEKLRSILANVTQLRDRIVIGMQLKLGLRASELANLELRDIAITAPRLECAYPDLGTHHALDGRENAVYIASRYERKRNKSHRPRVLPLDEELHTLVELYLTVRPDTRSARVFLTKSTHNPVDREYINGRWKSVFHPKYAETDTHSAVTSHFGRHRFTTHWRVHEDVPRELVKYMRGDSPIADSLESTDAIDTYVHTYYDDIEALYRNNIYTLGI